MYYPHSSLTYRCISLALSAVLGAKPKKPENTPYNNKIILSQPRRETFMLNIVKHFLNQDDFQQNGFLGGEYYDRQGACGQCGKCCTQIYLIYGQQVIDSIPLFESLKETNPDYHYFVPLDEKEDGLIFQCKHLQTDNRCAIYSDRPDFCRKYPSEQSLLMGGKLAEGCGFRFTLKKTFQQVLAEKMGKPLTVVPQGEALL